MKASFLLTSTLLLSLLSVACTNQNPEPKPTEDPSVSTQSESYVEYPFDSGDDVDMGFTKRELELLETEQTLLSSGSTVIEDQSMKYVELSREEMDEGIITDKYEWNGDIYELKNMDGSNNAGIGHVFTLLKNDEVLFEEPMFFSPLGAIIDWRMVERKPAFTFNVTEEVDEENRVNYTQDIWYDGNLMSEKYSVENPRYLFSYNGKLGFVATNNGMDSIFYDGKFITPGFTEIWTANCCSYTEILPTVYANGTLLFYAKRDDSNYLVEVNLNTAKSKAKDSI